MKKYIAFVLSLVCVLGLVGCSAEDSKEMPSDNTSIGAPVNEVQANGTTMDHDSVDVPAEDIITDVATPNLTMRTLKSLVERYGEDLTWTDFDTYYSEDIGSGLYILRYPIDTDYYLLIGGYPQLEPEYIRLVSCENSDDYIDIRTESIEDFINK